MPLCDSGENYVWREVLSWSEASGDLMESPLNAAGRVCSHETDAALTTAWQVLDGAINSKQRL
jgi:hypothetical protein